MKISSSLTRSAAVGALALLAFAGCSSSSSGGSAASVGGTTISVGAFQRELETLKANPYLKDQVIENGSLAPEVVSGFLQRDVYKIVIDQIFEERKLTVTPTDLQTARTQLIAQFATQQDQTGAKVFAAFPKSYQDDLIQRQAHINAVVAAFAPVDTKTYFEQRKNEFVAQCKSGKVVRHIAVRSQAQAQQIVTQLEQGADFAGLANQSLDTQTAAQGGFVGCYEAGQYAPIYDNAIKNLAVGQRTVIKTEDAYDIVEVNGVTADSLKSVILEAQRQDALQGLQAILTERLTKTPPQVNARFGTVVIDGNGFRIVAVGSSDTPRIRTKPTPTTSPIADFGGIPGR